MVLSNSSPSYSEIGDGLPRQTSWQRRRHTTYRQILPEATLNDYIGLCQATCIAKTFPTTTTPIHTVILNLLYTLGTIQPGRWHMTIHYIFYNYRIS